MSTAAPATNEIKSNPFQKYLFPAESKWACGAMRKAGEFGSCDNRLYAHVCSVALIVSAVALSAINAALYLIQTPFKCLLNIARFNPINLVKDLVIDIVCVIQSIVFVYLGVPLVIAGFIFPWAVFSFFAPEYYDTLESSHERLRIENEKLKIEMKAKEEKLDVQAVVIRDLQGQLDAGQTRRWF
ncbi:MAG: hypothetical protein K1000chlam2_00544 [Chlamydiae bacterium]|nr:hypothetical protein [Chlamydiota bacterium]